MKSKLLKLYDYKRVELEKEAVIEGVKREIDDVIRHIVKHYKKVLPADVIEDGDIVTLKSVSDIPKFNKNVLPVNVGRGLFDTDFEKMIIGMKKGEAKNIELGETSAEVTVLDIKRTIYPEITDEMVAQQMVDDLDYGTVKTVDELLAKVKEKQTHTIKEQMIYGGVNTIMAEVYENSEWAFDEDEIADYAKTIFEEEARLMNNEGIDISTLETEEDFLKAFGDIRSKEELDDILYETAKQTIAVELISCEIFGLDPDKATLDEETSKSGDLVDLLYNYISENVKFIEEE